MEKAKQRIIFVTMAALMSVVVRAAETEEIFYNATMTRNPMINPEFCGNVRKSLVCDPENILDQTKVREINSTIYELLGINDCPCEKCEEGYGGYVFGVLIVPRIDKKEKFVDRAMIDMARELREKWQLGSCDNDGLILVNVGDRRMYTATGERLKLHISGLCMEKAQQRAHDDHFANQQWGKAILQVLKEYGEMSAIGCYAVRPEEYINESWLYGVLAGLFVALILLIAYTVTKCNLPPPNDDKPRIA